ncbi:MAG: RNA-dependent RNA polymerase [Sanya permutotetravirus 2]|nr:MAG: RNA-dependent RNA polymerase [Sanya permutotetravirus 2]
MSNPIISKDRYTIEEMLNQVGVAKKQDLRGLKQLAAGAPRDLLSSLPDPDFQQSQILTGGGVRALDVKEQQLDLSCLKKKADYCPVSNLKYEGVQIHPDASHQVRGNVSVKRNFGRVGEQDSTLSKAALAAYPLHKLEEIRDSVVYTSGTPNGFSTRLRELTTRKCKSEGKPSDIARRLSKLLPTSQLPDWHDVDSLMSNVKITASASAGAPYWVNNKEAMAPMLEVVMPLLLDHLEAGTLSELAKEQPELFISELKNKTDRYAIDEVERKTRPYVCQGKHFAFLFSCLTQPFCHALHKWDEEVETMNAYGWSMAHGGINRVYKQVSMLEQLAVKKKTHKFKVGLYGDDGKIFMMTPKGETFSVDPDFKQMDGSVDFDTIVGVTKWMSDCYTEQHGESPLWDRVLSLMAIMASHPDLMVDGQTVYTKQKDGLLSGAVGTTLFDTAKSALAYRDLIDQFEIDPTKYFDAKWVTKYMLDKHGLVVKAGTWQPEKLDMRPDHGKLWTQNKFLGMRFMWRQFEYKGEKLWTLVPSLEEDEWLELIMHPRDDINTVGNKLSDVAKQRQSLDRARGYLVTGGIFNKKISEVLFKAIDMTPAVAVLMAVASGDGKGEGPELFQVVGEEFSYPTSEGVPNLQWVTQLYSEVEPSKDDWKPIFPTLHERIQLNRASWKSRMRALARAAHIPADPMTKFVFLEQAPEKQPHFPAPSTSFAEKGLEKKMPALGTTHKPLQSRTDYIEALIERDTLMPLIQPKPVLRKVDALPEVKVEGLLHVDQDEQEVFNLQVQTNVRALKGMVMPLTKEQPDLAWLNFLEANNGGKLGIKTTLVKHVRFDEVETPRALNRVDAYIQYKQTGKMVKIASVTSTAKAEIMRKAIVFKVYALLSALVEIGATTTRHVHKKDPGVRYSVPIVYTKEEQREIDALTDEFSLGPESWAYSAEVDEAVERKENLEKQNIDTLELTLLNQVKVAEELLAQLKQTISELQKNKNADNEEEKARAAHPKAKPSKKANAKTKTRGGHNTRHTGNRHRNS